MDTKQYESHAKRLMAHNCDSEVDAADVVVHDATSKNEGGYFRRFACVCSGCDHREELCNSVKGQGPNHRHADVNLRRLAAGYEAGLNNRKMVDFDILSGIKPFSKTAILNMQKDVIKPAIRQTTDEQPEKQTRTAIAVSIRRGLAPIELRNEHGEIISSQQIDISVDAAAAKRSYNRQYSARQLIYLIVSSETGMPIGYELMSNFCYLCFQALTKGDPRPDHAGCTWNHYQGIGTAEVAAARKAGQKMGNQEQPWVARHITSDGDCRSSHVIIEEVKKHAVDPSKVEACWKPCINHALKCLTKKLVTVKKDFHLDGILTIGRIQAIGSDILQELRKAGANLACKFCHQ
jgi:hypothetical protein